MTTYTRLADLSQQGADNDLNQATLSSLNIIKTNCDEIASKLGSGDTRDVSEGLKSIYDSISMLLHKWQ